MLSTLSVGLAAGVGLYALAAVGTLFVLGMLWVIESLEPERRKLFNLRVAAEKPNELRPSLEGLLRRQHIDFELRTTSDEEICYEVQLPISHRTDRLSNAIRGLGPGKPTAVEWDEEEVEEVGAARGRAVCWRPWRASGSIVSELEGDAEVVAAEQAHRFLKVVFDGALTRTWSAWIAACTFLTFWSFRNFTISRAASLEIPCCMSIVRRTVRRAGSMSPALKFFTGTLRRTRRVWTISQSASIFILSSAVSVRVFSAGLKSMSALAPLKS